MFEVIREAYGKPFQQENLPVRDGCTVYTSLEGVGQAILWKVQFNEE
jgi:hypothetical protein